MALSQVGKHGLVCENGRVVIQNCLVAQLPVYKVTRLLPSKFARELTDLQAKRKFLDVVSESTKVFND